MTSDSAAVEPRRSRRIQEIKSSQLVEYDESIDNSDYEKEDGQDSEEDVSEVEEAYSRKRKAKKSSTKPNKKAKPAEKAGDFVKQREEFEDHYIFQALNDAEVSITELSSDWVDQYKSAKDVAKKDLVNLVLNCVGCLTKIEEHDVSNNESASDTVGEIQTFFKRQKVHEFYLLSKKQEYKHLKKNFISFITQIITISDENGLLYENIIVAEDEDEEVESEDSNLMEDLLIWLSSFSVSSVRSLRYVSSLALLTIETVLCKIIKKTSTSLENFKHQLEVETKKKATAAAKKRIAQVESNIQQYINFFTILENFIKDIVNTTFIHRFKDVDHLIRAEAISSLGEWMIIYPELFFKVSYLKYLGWVLSDVNSSVRLHVLKTLIKLLKQNLAVHGLRQFFEKFESRIIEIAFHDIDHNVRNNSITLLTEMNKKGFIEEEEAFKVSSLIFDTNDKKSTVLVASFIQNLETEITKENLQSLESIIESSQEDFGLDLGDILKIRSLIKILQESYAIYQASESELSLKPNTYEPSVFAKVGEALFNESTYADLWELTIKYFVLDACSITSLNQDIIKAINLNSEDSLILFNLILGNVIRLKNLEEQEPKKKNQEDIIDAARQRLIQNLSSILRKVENDEKQISVFIQIFTNIPLSAFINNSELETFKSIYQILIKYFRFNDVINLKQEYISLMKTLASSPDQRVTASINSSFKDLELEIFLRFSDFVIDDGVNPMIPDFTQLYEDYIFKLLVLGTSFDITNVLSLTAQFKKRIFFIISTTEVSDEQVSQISSIFQLFFSATSWKLTQLLNSDELHNIEEELNYLPDILEEFYDVVNSKEILFALRSEVSSSLIDILVLVKNFYDEFESSGKTHLSNANRFKEIDLFSFRLSQATNDSLLSIFLSKEAIYANTIDIYLDRVDDEDITYNSLKLEINENDQVESEKIKWNAEKELVFFTAKLLMLYRSGLLDEKIYERISLNADKLGDLFVSVLEDIDQEDEPQPQTDEHPKQITKHSLPANEKNTTSVKEVNADNNDDVEDDDDIPVIEMEADD